MSPRSIPLTCLSKSSHKSFLNAICFGAWLCFSALQAADPVPLPRAHAHNDYLHARPLLDALDQGFGSVEADIFLVNGKLLVAHDRSQTRADRTLQALYLDPLKERIQSKGGAVHPGMQGFMLLVDIKAESAAVWPVLKGLLESYPRGMFSRFTDTTTVTGAVTVVLSGDRPVAEVKAQAERLCGLDARIPDLETNPSPHLYPLISDSWRPAFGGFDDGRLADSDQAKLRTLVAKAHSQGRRIRFWGVPDQLYAWRAMEQAGVDLLNTDKLGELAKFLTSKPVEASPK